MKDSDRRRRRKGRQVGGRKVKERVLRIVGRRRVSGKKSYGDDQGIWVS